MQLASQALCSVVGAAILKSTGHEAYQPNKAATAAVVGALPLVVVLVALNLAKKSCCGEDKKEEDKKGVSALDIITGVGGAAFAPFLGYYMLYANDISVDMSAAQFAASGAVGAAVFS